MRHLALVLLLLVVGVTAADDHEHRYGFEKTQVGELPPGWITAKTGTGNGSVWKIVAEKEAPGGKALAQTSGEGSGSFFNLCLLEKSTFLNFDATLTFKAVAGMEDQGGGLLWRCQDADNYYVARCNPLEDNYRVYKVVKGRRSAPLGNAKVTAPTGRWHTMRIVQQGDHIQCYLNGTLHLDVKDDTFKETGKVGFWTKADAQTLFADLKIRH